jgi:hypothetical protein
MLHIFSSIKLSYTHPVKKAMTSRACISRLVTMGFPFLLLGCAAMHSVSSGKVSPLRDGITYSLPVSYYRMSIGEGANQKLEIKVEQDIQPDAISFVLDISRNPLVDRVQNYAINGKGLITTAKSEDSGKLPDILKETAKSIVAISTPTATEIKALELAKSTAGRTEEKGKNQLSPAERATFLLELTNLKFNHVWKAGERCVKMDIPDKGGNFLLTFDAPKSAGNRASETDIRDSLRKVGRRAGAANADVDDDVLAAGLLARPLTAGTMTYTIYVKKEAVNLLRDQSNGQGESSAKELLEAKRAELAAGREAAINYKSEEERMQKADNALEVEKAKFQSVGKAAEDMLAAILKDPNSARKELEEFNKKDLFFKKSDSYWDKFGEALDASAATGDAPANKKAVASSAIALNTEIQKTINAIVTPIDDQLKANGSAAERKKDYHENWGKHEKALKDQVDDLEIKFSSAKKSSFHADDDIVIVVTSDRLSVVDDSIVQLIPLRRSMVDKATNEVTLVDGVVTNHSINEPSEVLGTVKIPLSVVEAVLDTVSTLWTKKKTTTENEMNYLKAEKALLDERKALEEARKSQTPSN